VGEAEDELDRLEGDLGSVQEQIGSAFARLDELRTEITSAEDEIETTAQRILRRKDELVDIVQELYKGGATSGLEVLMAAESLADLEQRADYLQSSGEVHLEQLEDLAVDRSLLLAKLDELDDARAEVADLLVVVKQLETNLQAEVGDQADEVDSLEADLEARQLEEALEAQRLEEALEAEKQTQQLEEELQELVVPPPPPPPAPVSSGGLDWDAIAECESGGDWDLDSTYDGGLQFHPDTWLGYGGGTYARYAWQASREQQIAIAEKVLAGQGPGAWPHCFQYG
jgi:peptidoglycan hydrolase CwlO-like protein